jgi:hypothetical protein
MKFDDYGSHLPVFETILSAFKIKTVLEFGSGKYSTPLLVNRCESVLSI